MVFLPWILIRENYTQEGIKFQVKAKHTAARKTGNQHGPAVQHRELSSILSNNLKGKESEKEQTHRLLNRFTPETKATLWINYTSIKQEVKGKKS